MARSLGLLLALALVLAACWPRARHTTATLPGDVTLTMTIRPLWGWHADWSRSLTVATPDGTSTHPLLDDTGWWRGSNLYRHTSGAHVLHEGQAGCIILTADPAAARPLVSCDKTAIPDDAAPVSGYPPSRFYADLAYIGQFVETPDADASVSFIPADQRPEAELPDIL